MESLTLPTTVAQAKAFLGPNSFSFPMSLADQHSQLSLPQTQSNAPVTIQNGDILSSGVSIEQNDAITNEGVSGILPTLQWVSLEALLSKFFTKLYAICRNIVATVNLDCRLDLKTIALHARNAEYNPKASSTPDNIHAKILIVSVLPQWSWESVNPKRPHLSSRQERWSSRVQSQKMILVLRLVSMLELSKNSVLMPNSWISKSRISSVVAMSSFRFVWRDSLTNTGCSLLYLRLH